MADTSKKALFSWALYDWANQSYFTMIQTFIFASYFAKAVAENESSGQSLWSLMIGITGIFIALSAPFLGAIADQGGRRKPWILAFTVLSVITCCLLWFITPGTQMLVPALVLVGLATFGAEYGLIFYNSMLPDLVSPDKIGRWSGWGWGLGYAGGLLSLIVALYGFVLSDGSWLGLNADEAENIRATFVIAGVWYGVFSIPFFVYTPDTPSKGKAAMQAIRNGMSQLKATIKEVKNYKNIVRFLIARMIYNDGVVTIFAVGGVYAAGTFNMSEDEIIQFGIGLNITAGIGAFGFAWLDDKVGSKKAILISIVGIAIPFIPLLIVESKLAFMIWALIMGIFVGPVQSASRSLMSRLAPAEIRTQMFGLYALSGKATAWAAPFLITFLTVTSGNTRIGMSAILIMLVIGFALMTRVSDKSSN